MINNWICRNCLFLKIRKTEFLLFGTNAKISLVTEFSLKIGDWYLNCITKFKYLGVFLDECLTWAAHVKYVLGKASKKVGMLGRLRKHLSTHAANTLYKSYVVPVLEYCGHAVIKGTVNP